MKTKTSKAPSKKSSWTTAKCFLIIFLPLAALMGTATTAIHSADIKSEMIIVENDAHHTVNLLLEVIADDFDLIVADLMILSETNALQTVLERENIPHRHDLAKEFLSFSKRKEIYDQIRFLDEGGMEVVRVNFDDGQPIIVPEDQLQLKRDRYYFKDTFQLEAGQVFVSPLDLNIEHGQIEQPLKPMIRFGTPVFDNQGQKRGIVLLNYFGAELIHQIERSSSGDLGQIMLLNCDGFWLTGGPKAQDEWGFMYQDRNDRTFEKTFPQAWQSIYHAESGQFRHADGLFTFATVYPLLETWKSSTGSGKAFEPSKAPLGSREYFWKVVLFASQDVLDARTRGSWSRFLLLNAGLTAALLGVSLFLARAIVNRKQAEGQRNAALAALQELNATLEAQVTERTAELQQRATEVEASMARLREAQDRLVRSERLAAIGELAASMAHELRNPLSVIRASAYYVKYTLTGETDDRVQDSLDQIEKQVLISDKIIRDLLDFARTRPPQLRPGDVNEVMQATLAGVPFPEEIVVVTQLAEGLPLVPLDPSQMERVLLNLITNAVQAMPEGGQLEVRTWEEDKAVLVSISDTGVGIPPENLARIFEPLFTTKTHGTGLGLSICRRIVEAHGGSIEVESPSTTLETGVLRTGQPGAGSTFTVRLPMKSSTADAES
jgi:signal transduction histidine kinase